MDLMLTYFFFLCTTTQFLSYSSISYPVEVSEHQEPEAVSCCKVQSYYWLSCHAKTLQK